ncbi:hypothetical protein CHARACLAT_018744, partial [Characodon lateralis]|nr:hypothetical protein [Characodon lateralis]
PSFSPGQPPVVFASPAPPQMNPTPQPRQPYYTNRGSLPPSSGPRGVPSSNAPRPVTPTHVYQAGPGSQMMMIPQQQLPFPSSPQGPAYFIGQYRSPTYVATPQQYSVPAGTPGFYPGTSPAEYGTYGKRLCSGPQLGKGVFEPMKSRVGKGGGRNLEGQWEELSGDGLHLRDGRIMGPRLPSFPSFTPAQTRP